MVGGVLPWSDPSLLFDGKKGILRPKNGLVFKLMPWLVAFYLGPTPVYAAVVYTTL